MNRGAWWATVHRVAKTWTWLRWLSMVHSKLPTIRIVLGESVVIQGTCRRVSGSLWTNPLYQMYMYLYVCVYVRVCTQINVYFRARSSIVFIRLPRKFLLVAFKLKIQKSKCVVRLVPTLDSMICKWTYSAREKYEYWEYWGWSVSSWKALRVGYDCWKLWKSIKGMD